MQQPVDNRQAMIPETLVLDAQQGDAEALAELVALARPAAEATARRHMESADADDVVQNAMLAVLTKLEQLADPKRFVAWLRQIVVNEVRNEHRGTSRQLHAQLKLFAEPRTERSVQPTLNFRAAIDRLPANQRHVLMRRYVDGNSYAETGANLGISVPLVRSRLQRARMQLRKELPMTDAAKPIDLTPNDLHALVRANRFRANDPKVPFFGILLEAAGRAVATDGHRLLIQEIPALRELPEDLLVEPNGLEDSSFGTEPGSFTTKLDEIEIKTPTDHWAWGIRDDAFPDYRKVLPDSPRLSIEIDPALLRQALAEIEPFLGPRHPTLDGFAYLPTVEIEISTAARRFTLTSTDVMGYQAPGKGVDSRPPPPVSRWEHQASFAIDIVAGHADSFCCFINAHYLADASNAVSEDTPHTLQLFAPHTVIVLKSGDGTRTSLTMPMA
jgi:RNA polymerase sigma-70 factor (ECF subfamily)